MLTGTKMHTWLYQSKHTSAVWPAVLCCTASVIVERIIAMKAVPITSLAKRRT